MENTVQFEQRRETAYDRELKVAKRSFDELLIKNFAPRVEDILSRENIQQDELPAYFQGVINEIIKGDGNEDRSKETKFIYDVYLATRNITKDSPLSVFARSLDTFDTLKENYLLKANKRELADVYRHVTQFRQRVIHPLREITLFDERVARYMYEGIYMFADDWVLLPESKKRYAYNLVGKSVIPEAVKLKRKNIEPNVFHTTGSAALIGIEKTNAILSSRLALEMGVDVNTGEFSEYISPYDDVSVSAGKDGHKEIFMEEGGISKGYELTRWFNEYSVTFAGEKSEIQKYTEEQYGQKSGRFYRSSEGMVVGPKVPLENITHMIVDHPNLNEARIWAQKAAPHLIVTSYDAYSLYRLEKNHERGFDRLEDLFKLPSFRVDEKGRVY